MKIIDLGEIALTETSLVMAFEKLVENVAPKVITKDEPTYKTLMRESLLTVPSQLVFRAARITELDSSQANGIPSHTDHFIRDGSWFLSLGGFIAHAVEPQK